MRSGVTACFTGLRARPDLPELEQIEVQRVDLRHDAEQRRSIREQTP
jgi:hypothetical protein